MQGTLICLPRSIISHVGLPRHSVGGQEGRQGGRYWARRRGRQRPAAGLLVLVSLPAVSESTSMANIGVSREAVSSSDGGHLILSFVSFVDSGQGLGKTQAVVSLVNLALDLFNDLGESSSGSYTGEPHQACCWRPQAAVNRGQL